MGRTARNNRLFVEAVLAQEADNENAMIDSTIVRAHQHSAGAKKGDPKPRRSGAIGAG